MLSEETVDIVEEITFSDDDIATAGLRKEGWYLFQLKNRKTQHVDGGVSKRTGKPYDAFDVVRTTSLAKARAVYNDHGEFQTNEDLGYSFPMSIDIDGTGGGLARLKGLYKAITERNLTGNGGVQSTLDELIGGEFWARLYHKKGSDGVLREELDAWRFRSKSYGPPQTVTVKE